MEKRGWWILTILYVAVVYLTLPVVPKIRDSLGSSGVVFLSTLIGAVLVLSFLYWAIAVKKIKDIKSWTWFLLILLSCVYMLLSVKYVSERIHLFEYGVLALFVYKALSKSMKSTLLYPVGLAIVSVIGIIDENIQGWLPNRYFGLHDIYLNVISGILGFLFVAYLIKPDLKKYFTKYILIVAGVISFLIGFFYEFETKHGNLGSINVVLMMFALAMISTGLKNLVEIKNKLLNVLILIIGIGIIIYFGISVEFNLFSLGYKRFFMEIIGIWLSGLTLRNLLSA